MDPLDHLLGVMEHVRDIICLNEALVDFSRTLIALLYGHGYRHMTLSPEEYRRAVDMVHDARAKLQETGYAVIGDHTADKEDTLLRGLNGAERCLIAAITHLAQAETFIIHGERRFRERSQTLQTYRLTRAQARYRLFNVMETLTAPRLATLYKKKGLLFRREEAEENEAILTMGITWITIDKAKDHTCSICHEGIDTLPEFEDEDEAVYQRGPRVVTTACCKQLFHTACLSRWLRQSTTCPMCRGGFGEGFRFHLKEIKIAQLATL
ncbi:hypothetical protein LTR10_016286 [Elasticomyces elasticus]|uniref:RING-type domain-containing protein n=1 Tax=Exophiala sideris TaxID=1016849 RepID=A0ABR0J5M0_9EURO|nr:hypothetical protein LTR10_016286 [Elasticomyces elasticus]KAK5028295.1 hypothetical protein LTS07_006386 [Exophiala sideris]KAK5036060.1 hypothetical protein LTR13_005630 [Exophiala sideris]KAK5057097.1 hypothetical protein LTR69_007735 [Exophiala sideris]KAK5181504.1 hypothetical protein LTR44_006299 [Eurotiomycetes sp. CCFEE 6388]